MLLRWFSVALVATAGCASSNTADVSSPVHGDGSADDAAEGGNPADIAAETDASIDVPTETSSEASEASGELLEVFPAQFTQESMPMRMLSDGDPVDLWAAPQGGHVVLFGAKVKNMTSDTATLKVRFRRPSTGLIVAEESRSVKMVPAPGEPGVLQPDIRSFSQVANVPLCPSIMQDGIVDEPFDVEVLVTALYTMPVETGTAHVSVVARCSTAAEEAFCRCECGPDYFLGKCSGSPEGGPRNPPDASGGLGGD